MNLFEILVVLQLISLGVFLLLQIPLQGVFDLISYHFNQFSELFIIILILLVIALLLNVRYEKLDGIKKHVMIYMYILFSPIMLWNSFVERVLVGNVILLFLGGGVITLSLYFYIFTNPLLVVAVFYSYVASFLFFSFFIAFKEIYRDIFKKKKEVFIKEGCASISKPQEHLPKTVIRVEYRDCDLLDEETFFPKIWEIYREDHTGKADIDGDYFHTNVGNRWSYLNASICEENFKIIADMGVSITRDKKGTALATFTLETREEIYEKDFHNTVNNFIKSVNGRILDK